MILIDAREGLSGDMLLAAMLDILSERDREQARKSLGSAAERLGLRFHLMEVEDGGDRGLGISYLHPEPAPYDASYEECLARLDRIEKDLGSESETGKAILHHIFDAEAEAHGVPATEVHLHEVGRPQALLNIAGIGWLASKLQHEGAEGFTCTTITTGSGIVVVSHGAIRVPAPASKILLRGLRHEAGSSPGERATPTGVAAVKALIGSQTEDVPGSFSRKGVGFGTKRFSGRLGRTVLLWL
jgi:hypothetical protein